MRSVLALLPADRFGSALGHVLDMPRDLLFRTAEFPQALLNLFDARRRDFLCFELSAVSTYETDLAVLGREDFWLIVAFRGSEDETEIHSG